MSRGERGERGERGGKARGGKRGRKNRGGKSPQRDGGRRLIVGRRFVLEGLAGGTVDQVLVEKAALAKLPELQSAADRAGVPITPTGRDELDALTKARHQGVVAFGPPYPYRSVESLLELDAPLLVALDEITDPQNFGAIIRSALVFGADGVIVPRHRSAALTPAVVRASAGATERARIAEVSNLQRALHGIGEQGLQIVGLAADGDVTVDALGPAPLGRVVVVGSEGKGLRRMVRERCHRIASIPQAGDFDSLNASVATGIALYEASRTR